MRLSYVLVAIATTLLATCNAGIAEQSKLASAPTSHGNISNRFLRSHETMEEKEEDPADDEEIPENTEVGQIQR